MKETEWEYLVVRERAEVDYDETRASDTNTYPTAPVGRRNPTGKPLGFFEEDKDLPSRQSTMPSRGASELERYKQELEDEGWELAAAQNGTYVFRRPLKEEPR